MKYPGRVIKRGEKDTKIVAAIQRKLNEHINAGLEAKGVFGPKTVAAVKLFQTLNTDSQGVQLKDDGEVGAHTWEALFGQKAVPVADAPRSQGLTLVLEIAGKEVGVQEQPIGSNRGKRVEEYLKSVGLGGGYAWCAAFTYWCVQQAADQSGKKNPLVKTGGVLMSWNKFTGDKISTRDAGQNPALIKPGQIFVMDYGRGLGHTGFVERVEGGYIHTIEGNTNDQNSREGHGVFRRVRKINSINKGFIDYKLQ